MVGFLSFAKSINEYIISINKVIVKPLIQILTANVSSSDDQTQTLPTRQ